MHRQFSLLVAVALATILGVGCGKDQKSPAKSREEKINKALNIPEVKTKVDVCKTLIGDRLKKEGLVQDKVEKCLDELEESLYKSVSQVAKANPDITAGSLPSKQEIKNFLWGHLRTFQQAIAGINNRKDLTQQIKNSSPRSDIAKIDSVLEKLGISDQDIVVLKNMFLDDQFMDQLVDTYVDWSYALAQRLKGV